MKSNGHFFISIIEKSKIVPGTWDPYHYRNDNRAEKLGDYVLIYKIGKNKLNLSELSFEPIEYQQIPKGDILIFDLIRKQKNSQEQVPIVREKSLIFGTMRAYLGNIAVTPLAEWISMKSPVMFPLNAEFVQIEPHDKLVYFWWAYLKSNPFLNSLPTGSGGTRPRVTIDQLIKTPVKVPSQEIRKKINDKLFDLAKNAWRDYCYKEEILKLLRE